MDIFTILSFIWELFKGWLWLFGSPIRDFNVLWILIPIWISWFFTEFFQEKKGTHFGNAITNGAIPIWVAIDWSRYLTNQLTTGTETTLIVLKFSICAFMLAYGVFVIVEGLKAKGFVHYVGRIRVITYLLVAFTPVIYGVSELGWKTILSIIVFFPVFYFLIELITRITPDSKAFKEDAGTSSTPKNDIFSSSSSDTSPFQSDFSSSQNSQSGDPFAQPQDFSSAPAPMTPAPIAPVSNPSFENLPNPNSGEYNQNNTSQENFFHP